jgi:uncharacterized protein involved in exopolysaccharide biosynthesis
LRVQLEAVLEELRQARLDLTDDHPDVIRLSRSAEVLRNQLEQAVLAGSQQASLESIASLDPVVQQLRQQVQTEQSYIRNLLLRRGELETKLEDLRGRVAAMPQIEREYELLTQDHEVAIQRYNAAVERIDAAERAQTLDTKDGGGRLMLVDAPFLPLGPYSPNRSALVMLVIMVAVGSGIALAILVDHLDESVKSSADLVRITGAPPLAVIPVLENDSDLRRGATVRIMKATILAGGVMTAVGIAMVMGG